MCFQVIGLWYTDGHSRKPAAGFPTFLFYLKGANKFFCHTITLPVTLSVTLPITLPVTLLLTLSSECLLDSVTVCRGNPVRIEAIVFAFQHRLLKYFGPMLVPRKVKIPPGDTLIRDVIDSR